MTTTGAGIEVAQQIADTLVKTFVEAGMAGHKAKPALMAKQGMRRTYTLSLPVGELLELVVLPEDQSQDSPTNRSITESWVRQIERGLRRKLAPGKDNAKYVLFPLTANIEENVATFRPLYSNEGQPGLADIGLLVLPQSAKIRIADGQHRIRALQLLVRSEPWLRDEAVNLFIIEESDTLQQRTDFADAAKVLPINVGLQAFFDSGVALNKTTHLLVEKSKMFSDADIEGFKATVSGQRNSKIWTYNSLRGYVGSAFVRGMPQKTEQLAESFEAKLVDSGWELGSNHMDDFVTQITDYLDTAIEETAGPALVQARERPDLADWDNVRTKSWILKPAGLATFGLLIHDLRQYAEQARPGDEHTWVQEQVQRVTQFDWSYGSSLFKGTLIKGGKTQGSSTAISHAAVILAAKLDVLEGIPRRTAESLLGLIDSDELELDSAERNIIRMTKRT